MTIAELAPSNIRAIAPYQPGKPISELAREMGIAPARIIKLASNENPLGMSPRARQAALEALGEASRYPDGNGFELKTALARKYGVAMDCIALGNGSNDVLELAARVFLSSSTAAMYSQHAFAVYPLATQAMGAAGIEVAARNFGYDLEAMLRAVSAQTRMVFIANPNNPTGTFVSGSELETFLGELAPEVVVVLDEAYNEYLAHDQRYDSVAWLGRFPNLIITRTFSKAYGLAGLRVGYGLANREVADLMNRVRQPFNVNSVALAAASAALEDQEFVVMSFEVNRLGLQQLTMGFQRLGVEHIPSCANFVAFRVGDAARVNQELLKQGVIVRPIAGYGLPQHLRVTVGQESENARFLEALGRALG